MYRRCLFLLAAAGLSLAACDDSSSPDGSASTVAVRAYVDADGSGTFTTGDLPLSGLGVTLNPTSGGTSLSAQTDAQGIATFEDVTPGSYAAQMVGTAPAGAVLSSAETPVVVAPFQGAELTTEFRYSYMPGTVSGVLYRDNNSNGQFDAGTDTPAPGLPVLLFGAGTAAIDSTTTSAAGAFNFGPRRPGSYRVVVRPLPTMTIVGGDTIQVTVAPQGTTPVGVRFTGNLLSTITSVRQQPEGSVVAFEGVATVGVGVFSTSTTGNQFNVQDASGAGILVLGVPLASGIQAGDSVRVIGTTQVSSGELVIRSTPAPLITKLGTTAVPAPRPVTAAHVAASTATDPLQGLLVKVDNVVVDSVQGGTAAGYNVYVRDAANNRFIVRVGTAAVGVTRDFWQVGRTYDVTGTLGNFNGPQVKIRSAADVRAAALATPIAVARTRAANDTVTVEGVVTAAPGPLGATTIYMQDASGGIMVFNTPAQTPALAIGDSIRVTARVSAFGNEPQLDRFSTTSPIQLVRLGTGTVPAPLVINGAQLASRTYEGRLVRIPGVRVDSVSGTATSTNYNVHVTTTDNVYMQVRIASVTGVGIPRTFWTVGNRYDVVGPLGWFNGVPQVKPRSAADVTAGTALTSIAQARTRPVGDTVLVEGIVTVAPGNFRSAGDNLYLQDATGGIQVFNVPTTTTIRAGDVIRVHGLMGANGTESQIVRFNTATPPTITVIGTAAQPAPRVLTAAEFVARTYEGQLARINDVEVVSVGTVSTSTGSYNVTVRFPDGTAGLVRISATAVGIPSTFWQVGSRYDVTGVLGSFGGTAQIYPRSAADAVRR